MSLPFHIVHESPSLLVVDKPAGLLSHASKPSHTKTLRDLLRSLLAFELTTTSTTSQVSIITRLDRETSGLVLVAKSRQAARLCGLAMMQGHISKQYIAITHGWPNNDTFQNNTPIIRKGEVTSSPVYLERTTHPSGAPAITHFEVLHRFIHPAGKMAVIRAQPITGRTHQIRVHLAAEGFPIVGDKLYGSHGSSAYLEFIEHGWTPQLAATLLLERHALHAHQLTLHPSITTQLQLDTGHWIAPLPPDLQSLCDQATG